MLAIPVINWLNNLVGMLKVRLGVASCMTSFIMIGARPSLRKVTPGSIPALP